MLFNGNKNSTKTKNSWTTTMEYLYLLHHALQIEYFYSTYLQLDAPLSIIVALSFTTPNLNSIELDGTSLIP